MKTDAFLIFNIFTFLNARDIGLTACLVCKKWFVFSTQNYHWSNLAIKRFGLNMNVPGNLPKSVQASEAIISCTNWHKYYKERIEGQLGTAYRLDRIEKLVRRYRAYNNPSFMQQIINLSNKELYRSDNTYFETWIQIMLQNDDEEDSANAVNQYLKPNIQMVRYRRDDTDTTAEIQSEALIHFVNVDVVTNSVSAVSSKKKKKTDYNACLYATVKFEFEEITMQKRINNSTIESEINMELFIDVEYNEDQFERKTIMVWEGYKNDEGHLECRKRKILASELTWLLKKMISDEDRKNKVDPTVMNEDLLLQFLMVRMGGSPDAMII